MAQDPHQPGEASDTPAGWRAPDIMPTMRFRDAMGAIAWLERAFGFRRHAVYQGEGGTVDHAELRFGSGMIMLGSARDDDYPVSTPMDVGGTTGGIYVVVADVDAHCSRAKAAGAEILRDLADQDYGSRDYSARDLEGHVWSFGTYRPSAGG